LDSQPAIFDTVSAAAGRPAQPDGPPRAGLLVTFEGGEGSGKSTQLDLLARWLEEAGRQVVTAREPGTTAVGEVVRRFLLETASDALEPEAELALFLAARAQLAAEVIAPALAMGRIVLVDRYGDSSVAYQGYGRGLDPDAIANANCWLTRGLDPDLTVLIEAPVGSARTRRRRPPDRLERAGSHFHERVHEGYQRLATSEPERFCVVDGTQPIEAIQKEIRARMATLLVERIPQETETP
jgi:dTMP kinase